MLHHPRDLASILCRRVASPVTTSLPDSIGVYGCLLTWIYIQCVNSRSKSMPNVVAERIKQRRLLSSKNLFKCIRLKNNADVFWYPKCQRKHYDNHFICIFWKPHSLPARSMAPWYVFSWHGSWNQVWNSETIGVWTSFRLQSCSISLLSWWYKPTGCPKFKTVIQLHLLKSFSSIVLSKMLSACTISAKDRINKPEETMSWSVLWSQTWDTNLPRKQQRNELPTTWTLFLTRPQLGDKNYGTFGAVHAFSSADDVFSWKGYWIMYAPVCH